MGGIEGMDGIKKEDAKNEFGFGKQLHFANQPPLGHSIHRLPERRKNSHSGAADWDEYTND